MYSWMSNDTCISNNSLSVSVSQTSVFSKLQPQLVTYVIKICPERQTNLSTN